MNRIGPALLAAAFVAASGVLGAQASTAGSEVHIYVSLADSATRFYPVPGHRMIIYRSTRDSAIAITDSSGSTTLQLLPGQYRLVSAAPVRWHGYDYSWNVPIVVRGAYAIIDLRAPDAVGSATVIARATTPVPDSAPVITQPGYYKTTLSPKDPSTAFLWSFFFAGAGEMYAGETGKGVALFTVSTGGGLLALAAIEAHISCVSGPFGESGCEENSSAHNLAVLGAVAWIGPWIYSMTDAGPAARRWNERHGLATASIAPVVRKTAHGREFGLSLTLQR